MYILVTVLHVIVSLFLVGVVLLQSGKAADLAGAFGGMGSQTVFGPRGSATVLTRATTIAAILFMVTSLSLSVLSTGTVGGSSNPLVQFAQPADGKAATPADGKAVPGAEDIQVIPQGGQPGQPAIPIQVTPAGEAPPAK
jgi:preprotein translocase subunit SecG